MFWGLTLEAGKRYAQQVETSFHLSMAALDCKSADANDVAVMVSVEKNDFLLCNLSKNKFPQQSMDLNFQAGDHIAFTTKGRGVVHLTGYLIPDDFTNLSSDEEGEAAEEESSEEEEEIPVKKMQQNKDDKKKRKNDLENSKASAKKAKVEAIMQEAEEYNSEEDSDFDEEAEEEEGGSEEEEEEGEEEEEDAESGSNEEEESDEEDESEEEIVTPEPKQKQKQKQQQQQQQQKQQNKTPNKPAMINGTGNQQESGKKSKKEKGDTPKGKSPNQAQPTPSPKKQSLPGGVMIEDLVEGKGPVAKAGRTASVYYVGRLRQNNKQFDSTQSGSGFRFRVGQAEVIKAWDIGVQGMKVGGKRRIICPPHTAYGNKGSPPSIPPNSWLIFDVELKSVS